MIKQTRTVVAARPVVNTQTDARFFLGRETYGPQVEGYGVVEIIERTSVTYLKADHTRFPGKEREEAETVVRRLSVAQALHLIDTLSKAVATSLDTGDPEHALTNPTVVTEEV